MTHQQPIVVIDDEPEISMIFSKILAESHYTVHHLVRAEDAFPLIKSNHLLKIVFLDIRLPGMDGLTALSNFLKINPSLRIIMMTAYQTVESVVEAMKRGAVDYLVKPLDMEMIVKAVEKYTSLTTPELPHPASISQAPLPAPTFVAQSPFMKEILSTAEKFSVSEGNILILGESGTGKEILSQYIHQKSSRSHKPFMVVDCTAFPESLFESELFGYEKGAFTGADTSKEGRFELANGGTLFLDEIGNVPLNMQAKLLRFMETRTISRLGSKKLISLDIRFITATNANLQKAVENGTFREDFYYRLSTLTIYLPPLRNRSQEEKDFLVRYLLEKNAQKLKRPQLSLSESARQIILDYPWPGNVRELENALYSGTLLSDSNLLDVQHLPIGIQSYSSHKEERLTPPATEQKSLKEILKKVEREEIFSALKRTEWNKKKASEILNMDYKNFLGKLKEYTQEENSSSP